MLVKGATGDQLLPDLVLAKNYCTSGVTGPQWVNHVKSQQRLYNTMSAYPCTQLIFSEYLQDNFLHQFEFFWLHLTLFNEIVSESYFQNCIVYNIVNLTIAVECKRTLFILSNTYHIILIFCCGFSHIFFLISIRSIKYLKLTMVSCSHKILIFWSTWFL